jgi:hypothetical protein
MSILRIISTWWVARDLEGELHIRPIPELTDGYSLVAVMLGHLRMNVDEAIDALITVATAVFPEGSQDIPEPETNSKNLKGAIEEMLQTKEIAVNAKMHERDSPQQRCKV